MYKFITEGGNTFEVKNGRLAIMSDDGETPFYGQRGYNCVRWVRYPKAGEVAVYRFPGTDNLNYIGVREVLR